MSEESEIRPPSDCDGVVRALWDFIDQELGPDAMEAVHAHLDACGHCKSHEEYERRLVQELAGLKRQTSDPKELRARIEAALKAARAAE